ncbi:hypothetical protein E4U09_002384 [Claviceps aff. purpurea]|uniref:GST N-terminal domain-containing protein n=1 Tax=Claviceps aff. purpurea TaxID=1967640 RepID=A0A9P7QKW5_9HYPO|nr:hypothetical protein E4U09_002384 [Claviceps aff. purpurea]
MSNTPSAHLTLYDIVSCPPVKTTCFAPNPWKARFALNFKAVPYRTVWVSVPDIPTLRSETLRMPPTRFYADGSPYATLPILHDPNASPSPSTQNADSDSDSGNHHPPRGVLIGDSFDIATHLETQYPLSGTGRLFPPIKDLLAPPSTIDDTIFPIPLSEIRAQSPHVQYSHFNNQVDALFSAHVQFMAYYMPLDPSSAEATKAEFVRRAGASSWEDFRLDGEKREAMKMSLRDALGVHLVGLLRRDESGPFVLGERATYADFIVGAWLKMIERTVPGEWEEMRGWHGGVFGELHDALEKFAGVM